MSASDTLPVSMMIGDLKPPLRNCLHNSRPSISGRLTSRISRSKCPPLTCLQALSSRRRRRQLELVVERKLLLQRFAQIVVVVDDEDLPCRAHRYLLRAFPANGH